MTLYEISNLATRNDLGILLNSLGLVGQGVEVGTHRGEFAERLLENWSGRLTCVDPWENSPDYVDQAKQLVGGGQDRRADFLECSRRLERFNEGPVQRATLLQTTSMVASVGTMDGSLDFVYLDGNHEPPYVLQDIELWWPKLRRGGILAGHDVVCPEDSDKGWGRFIEPEIRRYFQGHRVYLIAEQLQHLPWSYYIFKD